MSTLFCCDSLRRSAVEHSSAWNGIDFLQVLDDPAAALAERQTTLLVHFIRDIAPLNQLGNLLFALEDDAESAAHCGPQESESGSAQPLHGPQNDTRAGAVLFIVSSGALREQGF